MTDVGWHHNSMDMNLSKLRELVIDRGIWRAAVHGDTTERLNCTEHSPTLQNKTQILPQSVFPISKLPQALSIRGQTECKPQSQKTNQIDHMDHSLV